jgi:hypothetical protein
MQFLLWVLLLSFPLMLKGQEAGYKNAIGIYPLSLIGNGLEVGYERMLNESMSIRLTGGYFFVENPWYYRNKVSFYNSNESMNFNGLRIEGQYRYFFQKEASRKGDSVRVYSSSSSKKYVSNRSTKEFNWYIGGSVSYKQTIIRAKGVIDYMSSQQVDSTLSAAAVYGAGLFGIMMKYHRIVLDIYAGAGIMRLVDDRHAEYISLPIVAIYKNGINARGGLWLGLQF